MTAELAGDARSIASSWLESLDLGALLRERVDLDAGGDVDLVAVGKAAWEMASAAASLLDGRAGRLYVATDPASTAPRDDPRVHLGEHPVPGAGSWRAGEALLGFLDAPSSAHETWFLVSGGASSLCALPAAPLTLRDLAGVWDAALRTGADITTLNQLRATTSQLAGGAVLRHVRTPASRGLILVDNVISGAPLVASGLTYDYAAQGEELESILRAVQLADGEIGERLREAAATHQRLLAEPLACRHRNDVVAEPAMMLELALGEARRLGYRVIDLGARLHGDVTDVVETFATALDAAARDHEPVAVVGVGEVTVRLEGTGRGGRCQELAWRIAEVLDRMDAKGFESAFVARASDGRDFLEGVAGAWVDGATLGDASAAGIDWRGVLDAHDTNPALARLDRLLPGGHTGWNLCDLYVGLIRPRRS